MRPVQILIQCAVSVALGVALLFLMASGQNTTPTGQAFFGCPPDLVTRVNSSYMLCIRDVMNGTSGQTTTHRPNEDQLLKSNLNDNDLVSDEEYESEAYDDGSDRDLRNSGGYSASQQRRWARTAMYQCMVTRLMRQPFVQMLAADCSNRGSETRKNRCIMRRLRRSCPAAFAPVSIGASIMHRR